MIEPLGYEYKYTEHINELKDKIDHIRNTEPERFKGWMFKCDEEIQGLCDKIKEYEELEEKNKEEYCNSKLDLPVVLAQKQFTSLEGEVNFLHQGAPVFFTRFSGCSLHCKSDKYPDCHCDSEYSLKAGPETVHTTVREIVENIKNSKCINLSFTGGEPLLHKEQLYWILWHISYPLWNDRMRKERYSDYDVSIETNGAHDISWVKKNFGNFVHVIGDWKCEGAFGKKANQAMLESNLRLYDKDDALKFVVTEDDFDEVERILNMNLNETEYEESHIDKRTHVYLSPCYGHMDPKVLAQWIIDHRDKYDTVFNYQLHKFVWSADDIWA